MQKNSKAKQLKQREVKWNTTRTYIQLHKQMKKKEKKSDNVKNDIL